MTAEIAIINRQAIALAADSAVTTGKKKVWKGGNKLFSLGPHNDIAVMIYGAAEFSGFPWETIIKTFRVERAFVEFDTVEDCATDLVGFLRDNRFVADEVSERAQWGLILDQIEEIKRDLPEYKSKTEFRKVLSDACRKRAQKLQQDFVEIDCAPTLKQFSDLCSDKIIGPFAREVFSEVITARLLKDLTAAIYEFYRRNVESDFSTGVVVAGYGKKEFFGSVLTYTVDGKDELCVRQWRSFELNTNAADQRKTAIIPFAQKDMFQLFMEGIAARHVTFLNVLLKEMLDSKSDGLVNSYVIDPDARVVEAALQRKDNETILKKFREEFRDYRYRKVIEPIIDVVRALPKEDMADMAHALVELTSLRRKVGPSLESVGGPVDVAVITKSDGLIWIKRKHYFDVKNNQDFLYRKETRAGRNAHAKV